MPTFVGMTMWASYLRDEMTHDHDAVRKVHLLAFGEDSPGRLAAELRQSGDAVISLVAEQGTRLLGHVLFSRIAAPIRALTLAPVGVHPDAQKLGIGSALIREGLDRAKRERWEAVFVLGSPAYYGRFGFASALAQGYDSPYRGPDFMALLFGEAVPRAGRLVFPAAFAEDIEEHAARQRLRPSSPDPS
jgi:putative acetyltransferase